MKQNLKYLFPIAVLVVLVFAWSTAFSLSDRHLDFYVLDIGQGDAIFIETPSKNQILIDGGPDKSVLEELGKVMPFHDRSIDVVILTHPNLDHAAGLVEVLRNYDVKYFIDTDDPYPLAEYAEIKKIVEEKNITRIVARRGMKIVLDRGTELVILHPDKMSADNPNFNSIVAKLSFGEIDFMLTGDAEKGEELKLAQGNYNLDSEVLKVGHHGSKTSSNPLFLDKVKPDYALISVGAKNKYGHPTEDVISNLSAVGAKIFRTDVDSRIHIETDGKILTLVE